MENPFKNRSLSLSGPAYDIEPISVSDTADLPTPAAALYIETGGIVTFVSAKGFERSVTVSSNSILPVGSLRVKATGTTASGIHALVVQ